MGRRSLGGGCERVSFSFFFLFRLLSSFSLLTHRVHFRYILDTPPLDCHLEKLSGVIVLSSAFFLFLFRSPLWLFLWHFVLLMRCIPPFHGLYEHML